MAENEAGAAVDEQQSEFEYPVTIEEVGPAARKVNVEVPPERIAEKLEEQYKELRQQAAIPGFRPGHAPRKLVEKRFGPDVKEQVRRDLITESYEQVVEKNDLKILGEPEFDNPDEIKLPDDGPLNYSFQVEVMPDITLPELKGIQIEKPDIQITDERIDDAMRNLREQQGTLVPVEDRGVEDGDYLTADVRVASGENEIGKVSDTQLVSRPGRVAGIDIDDLDKQLAGLKPGETRTITVTAPESHANLTIRGKEVQIEVTLKELKRLELPEVNEEFIQSFGMSSDQELRDALKEEMQQRIEDDIQRHMRQQIQQYLLDNVPMELPEKLSEKQAERVVSRRAVDLMVRGMPREEVEANIEKLKGGAKDEAARELKLFFILQKVATDLEIDVDEAELNGRIAIIAAQRGQRPEKLKQEMAADGTLANLYVQMREQKALDRLLEDARTDGSAPAEGEASEAEKPG